LRRRRRRRRRTSCDLASCLQELRTRIIFIMGIVSTMLGVVGFGWGLSLGLVVGYFVFIYFQPNDVKDPIVKSVAELDTKTLQELLPEIPLWVKNPDYDRVDWVNKFLKDLWPYLDKVLFVQASSLSTCFSLRQDLGACCSCCLGFAS
jgi:hypothetical protein